MKKVYTLTLMSIIAIATAGNVNAQCKRPVTSAISGATMLCGDIGNVSYSVTVRAGSTYAWTISAGGLQHAGGTTNSILVYWYNTATQTASEIRTVTVVETNQFGCVGLPVNLDVTINPKPQGLPIWGSANPCIGVSSEYWVTSRLGSTYDWTITGAGTKVSGGTTARIWIIWTGPGTVSVTETNAFTCSTFLDDLNVNPSPIPATGPINGNSDVCGNTTVPYNVTHHSGSIYTWVITGGTKASGSNTHSITVAWANGTTGSVKVTETNAGCSAPQVTKDVTIHQVSGGGIAGMNQACLNDIKTYSSSPYAGNTYTWTITGGTQTSGGITHQIAVRWDVVGTTNRIAVRAVSQYGCVGPEFGFDVTVYALPVTGSISGSGTVCSGQNGVAYSVPNTAGSTYTWTITGGTQASGGTTSGITVNWGTTAGPGSVKVIERTLKGCYGAEVTMPVTINQSPSVTANNQSVCSGGSVGLSGTPSGGTWSGTGVSGSTFSSLGLAVGNYTVTYSYAGANGCSASASATVAVLATPTITSFSGVAQVCAGNLYNYSAYSSTSGVTYFWTFPSGWTLQTGQGAAITLQVPMFSPSYGPVTVKATAPNGCWRTDGITTYPASGCGGGPYYMTASPESTVFPNPAKSEVSVELPGLEDKDVPVTLYNDGGRNVARGVIKKGESKATFIDLDVPSGQYTIEIKRGDKTEMKRIIIVH